MTQEEHVDEKDVAPCGYRCRLCPAFRDNIRCEEDPRKVSDGWFRYYGFRIPPEAIRCDGCLPEGCENPRRIDPDCAVRLCAEKRGLPNCARCGDYVCDKLAEKTVDPGKTVRRARGAVPQEDYVRFIEPYDNRKILEKIRMDAGKCE